MSYKFIPEHVDPIRYAEQDLSIQGLVKIAELHRLSALILPSTDDIHVHLQFGVDEQGVIFLKGRLTVKLTLQCQRCMEPFIYEIMPDFTLGIVKTLDEADALPSYYEPVLMEEGRLSLSTLIEDEVILNLPIIAKHELEHCKVKTPLAGIDSTLQEVKNPFQVLESLKVKKKDKA
ncbi:MAG: hypothetical protein A3F12_00940 [Gammaproteobacteria bacterium RIFCSPHIGHO2_12_FULL_38_14]|nr:MAG: hypothetical protein A3F12_00940 [Gammaproteobacteria bacterium RIFCSPHIGHO2_12_FULL_38_14]